VDRYEAWEQESRFASTVVVDALVNFNQCRALEVAGLEISHQVADPALLSVFGKFKDRTTQVSLDTFTSENLACNSASFSGKRDRIDGSKRIQLANNFTIACTRSSKREGDSVVYPRAYLQLGTSVGTYTVVLPNDKVDGFDVASQSIAKFKAQEEEQAERSKAAKAQIDALQAKYDAVTAEAFAFFTGDGNIYGEEYIQKAFPYAGTSAKLNDIVSSKCGSRVPQLTLRFNHGGGGTGYYYYSLACVQK